MKSGNDIVITSNSNYFKQEQYEFLYHTLYQGVMVGQTTLSCTEFLQVHETPEYQNTLEKQFKVRIFVVNFQRRYITF